MRRSMLLVAAALSFGACNHVQIDTGAPVTEQVYRDAWAGSFLFGLVGPNEYALEDRCPNGVARLEVQHSFANVLASVVTLGLYTPVNIEATWANGPVHVPAEDEMRRRAFDRGGRDGDGGRGKLRGNTGGRGGRGRGPGADPLDAGIPDPR